MKILNSNKISRLPVIKKLSIGFLSALLIIPIDITNGYWETFSIPIIAIIIPVALVYFLKSNSKESLLMLFALFFSCLAILAVLPFSSSISIKPLGSIFLFFSPVTFYFLSRKIIITNSEFVFFLKASLYSSTLLIFSLCLSIFIFGDGVIREMGVMKGDFFLLSLSGTYGVHTLVAHYFLISIIVFYYAKSGYASKLDIFASWIVLLFLLYLMIFSLSREVLLAIIFTASILIFRYLSTSKAIILLLLVILTVSLGVFYLFDDNSSWATKVAQTMAADSLNELSSGRIELQKLAISQLANSPFTGTGFHGYELNFTSSEGYDDLRGWSTHAYYLTTIWKMGLVAGTFFLIFLFLITKDSMNYSKKYFHESHKMYSVAVICFFIFINLLWDALLATSVMSLFSFLVGSMRMRATN